MSFASNLCEMFDINHNMAIVAENMVIIKRVHPLVQQNMPKIKANIKDIISSMQSLRDPVNWNLQDLVATHEKLQQLHQLMDQIKLEESPQEDLARIEPLGTENLKELVIQAASSWEQFTKKWIRWYAKWEQLDKTPELFKKTQQQMENFGLLEKWDETCERWQEEKRMVLRSMK